MKLKIISEGPSVSDCRIVNAETGERLEGVFRVELVIDAHNRMLPVSAKVHLYEMPTEFVGEVALQTRPLRSSFWRRIGSRLRRSLGRW